MRQIMRQTGSKTAIFGRPRDRATGPISHPTTQHPPAPPRRTRLLRGRARRLDDRPVSSLGRRNGAGG